MATFLAADPSLPAEPESAAAPHPNFRRRGTSAVAYCSSRSRRANLGSKPPGNLANVGLMAADYPSKALPLHVRHRRNR